LIPVHPVLAGLALAAATLLLAACDRESSKSTVQTARAALAAGDIKAGVVHAKNLVRDQPENSEARFLLGKALLLGGEPVAAEIELRKARDLKLDAPELTPLLVRALVQRGEFVKAIEEAEKSRPASADARAETALWVASALLSRNRLDDARRSVASALAEKPGFVEARLFEARIEAVAGNTEAALKRVDAILAAETGNVEALELKGNLLATLAQFPGAEEAYRAALKLRPAQVSTHASLLRTLVVQGKLKEGQAQLAEMIKAAPNHPQTHFNTALMKFLANELPAAREAYQRLLARIPEHPIALQLAGAIEYRMSSLPRAEKYLSTSVRLAPENLQSRRWLAMTYSALGQPGKALAVIDPVRDKLDGDTAFLAVAGDVYMQIGDIARGEALLVKAAKADPNPTRRTSVALARYLRGDTASAFTELAQISAEDKGTVADMALLSTRMRRGELELAHTVLDGMDKKRPGDPQLLSLRAQVYAMQKDSARARQSYGAALAKNPTYFAAVEGLARLDLAENRVAEAHKRFETLLAADPKNTSAIVALADLKSRAKAPTEEVVSLLERGVAAAPAEIAPRAALVAFLIGANQTNKAIAAAQDAVARIPDTPGLLDLLGRAQLLGKEYNQSISTFSRWAQLQPQSVAPHLRIADVHVANRNPEGAASSLRKALEVEPDNLAVQQRMIGIDIALRKYFGALETAKKVQKQRPGDAVGFLLEGDVHLARSKWGEAVDAFAAGMKLSPKSTELARRSYSALINAKRAADAEAFAARWIRDNPGDLAFRKHVGELAAARELFDLAIPHLRAILKALPDDAEALNNLAWALHKIKDAEALALAEQANKVVPNQPAFMHTLGLIVLERGDTARAIELLRDASRAAPQLPTLRLDHARALVLAGRKSEAQQELVVLSKQGERLKGYAEVLKMLREN
jgi:putative PEP-CTERM system TPR-repeat lipoprotein